MKKAEAGDTIRVHFSGFLDDGKQFATTRGEDPLELTIGEGKLIACFEQSVIGMQAGEQKTVRIEPVDAFGERDPELVSKVPRHQVPEEHEDLAVGSKVQLETEPGKPFKATITALTDQVVTLDANPPLAGEALTFDIELVEFV